MHFIILNIHLKVILKICFIKFLDLLLYNEIILQFIILKCKCS